MDTSTLKALLWKDFRQNRLVLVVALGILLLSGPAVALASYVCGTADLHELVSEAFLATVTISTLLVAMLGGIVISADQADRSAAFLAYLPPARKTVVLSKSLCAASVAGLILLFDIALIGWSEWRDWEATQQYNPFRWKVLFEIIGVVTATGLLMFGTAWLAGCLTGSPAIAVCLGIAAGVVLGASFRIGQSNVPEHRVLTFVLAAMLGLSCFAAGCLHALHRKADV